MNEDIQTQLLYISQVLNTENVKELVFLCGDKLRATEKQHINDGNTLFLCLQKKGLVSEDLLFLKEILFKIGRNDILITQLSMTHKEIEELQKSPRHISPYRSLLYHISQELDSNDVKNVKFSLYPQNAKLENTTSMLDVLTEMEKDLNLSENNLELLKKTLDVMNRKDLLERILQYENQGRQATYLDSTKEKTPIQDNFHENSTNRSEKTKVGSGKGKNLEQYSLYKKPHGWCVILNNEDFEKAGRDNQNKRNIPDRTGTNRDAEAIRRVFEKRNYTVKEHKNLTGEEMLNIMELYQKKDHLDKDSFICFILSHGRQGTVLGVDGKEVLIKGLTSRFNGSNCGSLNGKPKIFFIQACQGDELDRGVPYEEDNSTSTYESDGGSLPVTADFLIAYASTEDYVSLRGSEGSVYIQNLCESLENLLLVQEDLISILTIVQQNIAAKNYNVEHQRRKQDGKQMPSHTSGLRKKLILPPPENMQSH